MGLSKYQEEIQALFKKSPVVDFASIERLIHNKDKNIRQYTKILMRNLLLKKKIYRITKGYYSLHEDPSLFVFCVKPAYFGLQDALSAHALWEQETIPIILTTQHIRQGIRTIFETHVLVKRIEETHFFGIEYIQQGNFFLPFSDIEKTLLDMLYFRQRLDAPVLQEIKKKMDIKKLKKYLLSYPKEFRDDVSKILNI
jgi:predicted transcriptional regulator of viral defense system